MGESMAYRDEHPVEDLARACVAAILDVTGETLTDLAAVLNLTASGVSQRQSGHLTWKVRDLGHLADHWEISPAALLSTPADVVAVMSPQRINELRGRRGLNAMDPVLLARLRGAETAAAVT